MQCIRNRHFKALSTLATIVAENDCRWIQNSATRVASVDRALDTGTRLNEHLL